MIINIINNNPIWLLILLLGWDAGCLSMKEGEVAKLFISSELGYGSSGYSSWKYP